MDTCDNFNLQQLHADTRSTGNLFQYNYQSVRRWQTKIIENNGSPRYKITAFFPRDQRQKNKVHESCTSSPCIGDVQRQPVFGGVNWQIQYKSGACSLSSSASKARSLKREWILSCCLNPWIASYHRPNTAALHPWGNKMARWNNKTVISQETVFEIGSEMSSKKKKVQKFTNVEKDMKVAFYSVAIFRNNGTFAKNFFVLWVLNEPLVRLKREPPLGFRVRSHHCLCHHLLWLPNLCSGNQGSQTSTEANTMERWWWRWCVGGGLLSGILHKAATASTRLIGLKSQLHHFCTESARSPTHGKTTVRWYSQPVTPWELAVSGANGDQCAGSWICFPPKLLITEVTLMWRGHFSQVTLIHLLAPCFVSFWLKPLTISLFVRRWRDLINLVL